jgi:hypothetical protein
MWRLAKRLTSEDEERRVDFMVHTDGRVRFDEYRWFGPWEEDGVALDQGYWSPGPISGYYASLTHAEKAALSEIPWLRSDINAPDESE